MSRVQYYRITWKEVILRMILLLVAISIWVVASPFIQMMPSPFSTATWIILVIVELVLMCAVFSEVKG